MAVREQHNLAGRSLALLPVRGINAPFTLDARILLSRCIDLITNSAGTVGGFAERACRVHGPGFILVEANSPSALAGIVGLLDPGADCVLPVRYQALAAEDSGAQFEPEYDPTTCFNYVVRVMIRHRKSGGYESLQQAGVVPCRRDHAIIVLLRSGRQAAEWMRIPTTRVSVDRAVWARNHRAAFVCLVCAAPCTRRCTACRTAAYCDREHQAADWGRHRAECQGLRAGRKEILAGNTEL